MYIWMLKLHCYIYKAVQHALHIIFFTQSNHIACQRQIFCLRHILSLSTIAWGWSLQTRSSCSMNGRLHRCLFVIAIILSLCKACFEFSSKSFSLFIFVPTHTYIYIFMPLEMITDSNLSISLFTGFLHVNIVAHHRLQTIVEQCIKYLIHASAIRDFKLVIALVLYIVHMASDSGADTG